MKKVFIRCLLGLVAGLGLNAGSVSAQMFSVGDQVERESRPRTNTFFVGVAPAEFSYRGITPAGERVPMEFSGMVYRAVIETPTLTLFSGFGFKIGDNEITSVNAGAIVQNRVMLSRGANSSTYLPLRIMTDWRSVRNTRDGSGGDEFQQSAVLVGSGIGQIIRIGSKSIMDISANGNYGYAVRSFGADGGQTYLFEGKARYHFSPGGNRVGFSVGYDFAFQDYLLDGDVFDYRYTGHSIMIGIRF